MHSRVLVIAVLGFTACTAKREVPPADFACTAGGPCPDAGVVGRDAGPSIRDAGTRDGGQTLAQCAEITRLPANGLATGSNIDATNKYDGPCFPRGGNDVVYGFTALGRLRSLRLTLETSTYDTGLHLYRGDCQPVSIRGCNDDDPVTEALQSNLIVEDLPPGDYAIVIDGYEESAEGSYVLSATGIIAPGEPCDPTDAEFLRCAFGTCVSGRCPNALDCADGVDADGDGDVDEDAATCVMPPQVACTAAPTVSVSGRLETRSDAADDGRIVSRRWSVADRPAGSIERIDPSDTSEAIFIPELAGTYRLQHVVADDDLQLGVCSTSVDAVPVDGLHVELLWNEDESPYENYRDLALHLLHPSAPAWFDDPYDCYPPDCAQTPPDWGPDMLPDDPYAISYRFSPTRTSISVPQPVTYLVGVHYLWDDERGPASATVRIFCGGSLEAELGPVTLLRGNESDDDNDFWKVGEVTWDGVGGCTVMPYGNLPGAPLIVLGSAARMAR